MRWDPGQYGRYADERGRPFVDLVARIDASAPRRVVDLGCGPGNRTALLAARWPDAAVEGIDSSEEMIASALPLATGRLSFDVGDVAGWAMPADADVVLSNATLQWVPDHQSLVTKWASTLPAGGWLAFQVPGNFASPSHALMRAVAGESRWSAALEGVLRHHDSVGSPSSYASLLLSAGLVTDVWETTYLHVLTGSDPVLEWLRGTALRPVLAALSDSESAEFCAALASALRAAYPATEHGTIFPFRRIFAVGHRR
jgi:trans-aconitate 2-methyltransferase